VQRLVIDAAVELVDVAGVAEYNHEAWNIYLLWKCDFGTQSA
jgi:hypothetical protein